MAGQGKIFLGENVCVEGELKPAAIFVRDGKIIEILDKSNLDSNDYPDCQVCNFELIFTYHFIFCFLF